MLDVAVNQGGVGLLIPRLAGVGVGNPDQPQRVLASGVSQLPSPEQIVGVPRLLLLDLLAVPSVRVPRLLPLDWDWAIADPTAALGD